MSQYSDGTKETMTLIDRVVKAFCWEETLKAKDIRPQTITSIGKLHSTWTIQIPSLSSSMQHPNGPFMSEAQNAA